MSDEAENQVHETPASKQVYDEIKDVFDHFDMDRNGSINNEELGHLLKSLGENPNPSEIRAMIDTLDKDGNGSIEWEEFYHMMMEKHVEITPEEEVRKVFEMFDKD